MQRLLIMTFVALLTAAGVTGSDTVFLPAIAANVTQPEIVRIDAAQREDGTVLVIVRLNAPGAPLTTLWMAWEPVFGQLTWEDSATRLGAYIVTGRGEEYEERLSGGCDRIGIEYTCHAILLAVNPWRYHPTDITLGADTIDVTLQGYSARLHNQEGARGMRSDPDWHYLGGDFIYTLPEAWEVYP